MNKWVRYFFVAILVLCLILVRKYEDLLFYDPFLVYFKGDFYGSEFPEYNLTKVAFNIIFRYLLNSAISLAVIWFLFWNMRYVKFSAAVLLVFLVTLLPIYLYFIANEFHLGENIGFYIRRFLIQPLLLLVLIPAFFYQQQRLRTENSD